MAARRSARARAIEGFARDLAALREAAGRPSFRVMAGRSHAISHTTLHEASQGHRLPSWETTTEYVRACGGDPEDFRERWTRARRHTCGGAPRRPEVPPEALVVAPPAAVPSPSPGRDTRAPSTRHLPPALRRVLVVAIGAAVVALTVGMAVSARVLPPASPATPPGAASAALPVEGTPCSTASLAPSSPTPSPRHPGDVATLVADVTLQDCARVPTGVVRTKTWRLRNTGTVPWTGYSLRRLELPQDGDTCQTIPEVPVPTTLPGESSEVSVEVVTPRRERACLVHFALTDAAGDLAFPGRRPLHLLVEVG